MLLEGALENAAISHASIEGFGTAARSHTAVGEAIAAGLADVGVGLRAVGAMSGLDLVPLRNELYELIVPDHFLDLPAVQALLDLLRRPAVRAQIGTLPGYDVVDMGLPSTDPVSGSARSAP